jgi:hypothetical protein
MAAASPARITFTDSRDFDREPPSHARWMRACAKKFRRENFALQRVERAVRSRKNSERTAPQSLP